MENAADEAIRWWDDYYRSVDRVVLTERELRIPGVRVFGWHDMKRAVPALSTHFHENCFEIVFVTKGMMTFFADGQEYAIHGSEAFVTFPNEVHSTNDVPMPVGEILWFQLDVSRPEAFLFLQPHAAESLITSLQQLSQHQINTAPSRIWYTLKYIKESLLNTANHNPYLVASLSVVYLYQLLACTQTASNYMSLDMAQACEYIRSHLRGDLPLEEIADYCHSSVSHFKQKFKAQIGVSPRNYINQQKIEQIRLELQRDKNLTRIASDFGFCNSAYFSVVFKKYTNQTPTEYLESLHSSTKFLE